MYIPSKLRKRMLAVTILLHTLVARCRHSFPFVTQSSYFGDLHLVSDPAAGEATRSMSTSRQAGPPPRLASWIRALRSPASLRRRLPVGWSARSGRFSMPSADGRAGAVFRAGRTFLPSSRRGPCGRTAGRSAGIVRGGGIGEPALACLWPVTACPADVIPGPPARRGQPCAPLKRDRYCRWPRRSSDDASKRGSGIAAGTPCVQ